MELPQGGEGLWRLDASVAGSGVTGDLLAHNIDMVPDYVKAVTTSSDLETIFYREGGGLAVTLKKR